MECLGVIGLCNLYFQRFSFLYIQTLQYDWSHLEDVHRYIQTLHKDCSHIEDVHQRRRSGAEFSLVLLTVPRILLSILFCVYRVQYTGLSVPVNLVITCWERADHLTLLCLVFPCVFVIFLYGVSDQVWYLILSIPDFCLLFFNSSVSIAFVRALDS